MNVAKQVNRSVGHDAVPCKSVRKNSSYNDHEAAAAVSWHVKLAQSWGCLSGNRCWPSTRQICIMGETLQLVYLC